MSQATEKKLEQLVNWKVLHEKLAKNLSGIAVTTQDSWQYHLQKVGQELELSRYRFDGQGTILYPWYLKVQDIVANQAKFGQSIKYCTCEWEPSDHNIVKTLVVKFDYYTVRFAEGKFYMPFTHSFLIDAGPYMAMVDELIAQAI